MNSKTKRRMAVVTGVIIIVIILILAIVGGSSSAKTVTIAEILTGEYDGSEKKVQVTGNVVDDSYSTTDDVLTFLIYDPDGDSTEQLEVSFEGGVSATFGNDVTAICTGTVSEEGVLICTELVTKCPSKYESSTDSLSVDQLLEYGDSIVNTVVKVSGYVKEDTLTAAGSDEDRFVIVDAEGGDGELSVLYDDALSDEITDGTEVVLTGALDEDGKFVATDVAIASE